MVSKDRAPHQGPAGGGAATQQGNENMQRPDPHGVSAYASGMQQSQPTKISRAQLSPTRANVNGCATSKDGDFAYRYSSRRQQPLLNVPILELYYT